MEAGAICISMNPKAEVNPVTVNKRNLIDSAKKISKTNFKHNLSILLILPYEIWFMILYFVNLQDISNLLITSKFFQAFLDNSLVKHVIFNNMNDNLRIGLNKLLVNVSLNWIERIANVCDPALLTYPKEPAFKEADEFYIQAILYNHKPSLVFFWMFSEFRSICLDKVLDMLVEYECPGILTFVKDQVEKNNLQNEEKKTKDIFVHPLTLLLLFGKNDLFTSALKFIDQVINKTNKRFSFPEEIFTWSHTTYYYIPDEYNEDDDEDVEEEQYYPFVKTEKYGKFLDLLRFFYSKRSKTYKLYRRIQKHCDQNPNNGLFMM